MVYLWILVLAVILGGVVMALVIRNNAGKAEIIGDAIDDLKK